MINGHKEKQISYEQRTISKWLKKEKQARFRMPTVSYFAVGLANESSVHVSTSFVRHVHVFVLNECVSSFRRRLRNFEVDFFDFSVSTEDFANFRFFDVTFEIADE